MSYKTVQKKNNKFNNAFKNITHHALVKLTLDDIWVFAAQLNEMDAFFDLVQDSLHVSQLGFEVNGTLELPKFGHHFCVMFLKHT